MQSAEQKLELAAGRLVLAMPFVATIFSSMRRELTDQVPTAATNGLSVKFNPEFVDKLTVDELIFVCAHEAMHVVLLHSYRLGERNPELWNIAGDAVINAALIETPGLFGTMPKAGVLIDWVKPEHDTEWVYQKLYESAEKYAEKYGAGGFDGSGDLEQADADKSEAESELEVRTLITQAAKAAYAAGTQSALLGRVLGILKSSTTDWKEETRAMLTSSSRDDYTYRRFARRFIGQDMYLPSLWSESLGPLVLGIDTSGSMTQDQLNIIAGDVTRIAEDCKPAEVIVIYCDSSVNRVDRFAQGEDVVLRMCGGGGTAFHPVYRKVEELDLVPAGLIYFTDMEGDFDFPGPDYPVLWGAVNARQDLLPAFGRRVEVRV